MCRTIPNHLPTVNAFLADVSQQLAAKTSACIEARLEQEVTAWLHRAPHQRRRHVQRQTQAHCQRCGTHDARNFSRNGRRRRQLVTTQGVLDFWLPRVVCTCGGSVTIPFSILQPYQRWWHDLNAQIARWADYGLSLRQMQTEIGIGCQTPVGLRKLNAVVQTLPPAHELTLTSVPPIIMLDAIWVTLLTGTQTTQRDRLGRQREVKIKHKVCVMVALGLYPQTQRWGILSWHIADSESQEEWEALLLPLEDRGVYRERGVALFIHDGNSGLKTALALLHPHVPHQRCVFHKLRNLWRSIQPPTGLTAAERRAFKRELLTAVQPIFYADDEPTALQLRQAVCTRWQSTQPQFVDTLRRDWHETIAFYRVLSRYPNWSRTALRTTSLLERVNRMIRRLFRAAGAFHSSAGLRAAVARTLNPKRLT